MRYFYECGGCDNYHPLGFVGDCREDKSRYNMDDFGNMVNPFNEGVDEHFPTYPPLTDWVKEG